MWCQGFGFFHIGGVIAAGAVNDGVLTGGRYHLKLFAQVAANGSAVGSHCSVAQAKTVKNAPVGLRHGLVADFGAGLVTVKAVGVFHDELAPPHETKTGPALIAKLGLNLIIVARQLLVAADILACNVCHHLFTGGLHHEVPLMPVFDTQQLWAHLREPPGLVPQLSRLHHWHSNLNCAGAVHFFTDNRLDLAHHPQPQGHQGVDAGANFFDHAGARHQPVASDFGVAGSLLEGRNKKLGGFHGFKAVLLRAAPLAAQPVLCIIDAVEKLGFDYA